MTRTSGRSVPSRGPESPRGAAARRATTPAGPRAPAPVRRRAPAPAPTRAQSHARATTPARAQSHARATAPARAQSRARAKATRDPARLASPFLPSPRERLAAPDRRTQILAAALAVFSEQGFHGTRTRELAERAGVSEALVFHHFPTKEALIRAIFDLVGFEERIRVMEERFSRMPPREALVALATHVLANLREQPDIFRVIFFGILETPELAGEFYRTFLSRLLALETKLFARAYHERRGRSRAEHPDPAIVARAFHGSLLFYNLAGAVMRMEPLPRDPEALAVALVNVHLPEARS